MVLTAAIAATHSRHAAAIAATTLQPQGPHGGTLTGQGCCQVVGLEVKVVDGCKGSQAVEAHTQVGVAHLQGKVQGQAGG